MASRVVMPKLTDTMEEGVVVQWKKKEKDPVQAGDVLAEIETDKAVMDLEAFSSGTLRRILVKEGDTVPSGTLIAVIGGPDEDISEALSDSITAAPSISAPKPPVPQAPRSSVVPPQVRPSQPQEVVEHEVKASPRARTLARERGIDLATLTGTGPGGRIVERDVTQASTPTPSSPKAPQEKPLSQMRKAIARATTQSKGPVPHFYLTTDIAMHEAERFRKQFKQISPCHLSLNDMIIKAAALALTRHPEINVSYGGDVLHQHSTIDIGIAVGLDDGLVAPVLRDCGTKSLTEVSSEAQRLISRARDRQLTPEEYTGATFSISNLGMYDVDNFIAVLMPPEAAALAVGSVREVPIVEKSKLRLGRRMNVTLSCDHRALDGVQAARFLKEFKRILEHPLELVLSDAVS